MCITTGNLTCRPSRQAQNLSGNKRPQSEISKHRDLETWTPGKPSFPNENYTYPCSGMLQCRLPSSVTAEYKLHHMFPAERAALRITAWGKQLYQASALPVLALWEENSATEF